MVTFWPATWAKRKFEAPYNGISVTNKKEPNGHVSNDSSGPKTSRS